jgi:transposase
VFLCKNNTADAHEEIDGEMFEKYFSEQLIPNLPPKSVIVVDNASYHSRKKEQLPTKSWRKDKIKEWLNVHNNLFGEDLLKKDLKDIVDSERFKYDGYKIDDMAKTMGHSVLRLPPYHCELNPIELVWAQIKHNVNVNNTQFQTNLMDKLIHEGFGRVTVENWRNYVRHVKEIEAKMWRADEIQDNTDPLIIDLGDDKIQDSQKH